MATTKNSSLHSAKKAKNDEYYTQITDISKELMHYKEHFKDKIVFCNCDDPTYSNFWRYFHLNFEHLGLKKLISTHYDKEKPTYKMEYYGGNDNNIDEGIITPLEGNGDFRNQECLDLLEECDIVVTNPPFSLARDYIATVMSYNKKFLVIGNINWITYKEVFPLLKENKIWLGNSKHTALDFIVPDDLDIKKGYIDEHGKKHLIVQGICWYTNLDIKKRHEELILYKHYTPEEYPTYDNYDAINVDKVLEIPCDYFEDIGVPITAQHSTAQHSTAHDKLHLTSKLSDERKRNGVMGVPITFMEWYNPEQFELLGIMNTGEENIGIRYPNTPHGRPVVNGKEKYLRILIRRKKIN